MRRPRAILTRSLVGVSTTVAAIAGCASTQPPPAPEPEPTPGALVQRLTMLDEPAVAAAAFGGLSALETDAARAWGGAGLRAFVAERSFGTNLIERIASIEVLLSTAPGATTRAAPRAAETLPVPPSGAWVRAIQGPPLSGATTGDEPLGPGRAALEARAWDSVRLDNSNATPVTRVDLAAVWRPSNRARLSDPGTPVAAPIRMLPTLSVELAEDDALVLVPEDPGTDWSEESAVVTGKLGPELGPQPRRPVAFGAALLRPPGTAFRGVLILTATPNDPWKIADQPTASPRDTAAARAR